MKKSLFERIYFWSIISIGIGILAIFLSFGWIFENWSFNYNPFAILLFGILVTFSLIVFIFGLAKNNNLRNASIIILILSLFQFISGFIIKWREDFVTLVLVFYCALLIIIALYYIWKE